MDSAIYVGLSRQMVLRRELDIAANNIANVDTAGFKLEDMMTRADPRAPAKTVGMNGPVNFVMADGVARDFTQGNLHSTGAPLDLAIEGKGFFKIATASGDRFTRDGRFKLDPNPQDFNVGRAQGSAREPGRTERQSDLNDFAFERAPGIAWCAYECCAAGLDVASVGFVDFGDEPQPLNVTHNHERQAFERRRDDLACLAFYREHGARSLDPDTRFLELGARDGDHCPRFLNGSFNLVRFCEPFAQRRT